MCLRSTCDNKSFLCQRTFYAFVDSYKVPGVKQVIHKQKNSKGQVNQSCQAIRLELP